VAVARELTKKFEEIRRGTAAELLEHFRASKVRGEITFLVEGEGGARRGGLSSGREGC
jgi:16S rRNA (cytidine1402-2'-O)-methyltransferase